MKWTDQILEDYMKIDVILKDYQQHPAHWFQLPLYHCIFLCLYIDYILDY